MVEGQIFYELSIKVVFFCFLQTNNIAQGVSNFVFNRIPFPGRVNSPNIPSHNVPTCVHTAASLTDMILIYLTIKIKYLFQRVYA